MAKIVKMRDMKSYRAVRTYAYLIHMDRTLLGRVKKHLQRAIRSNNMGEIRAELNVKKCLENDIKGLKKLIKRS